MYPESEALLLNTRDVIGHCSLLSTQKLLIPSSHLVIEVGQVSPSWNGIFSMLREDGFQQIYLSLNSWSVLELAIVSERTTVVLPTVSSH